MRIRSAVFVVVLGAPLLARAHFKLDSPASLSAQSSQGNPQKTAPCGQDDGVFELTNEITTVAPGASLEISVTETVGHPGHFRVTLADSMSQLPDDPIVTPTNQDECASVDIEDNPTLPLLADGLLPHTAKLPPNSKMTVTLPTTECQNCVLQVVQYMRNHPAPCFYHHCATINISNSAPPPTDGAPTNPEAGVDPVDPVNDGGCCSANTSSPTGIFLALAVAGLLRRRRR